MPISPVDLSSFSASLAQFKSQSLTSLFGRVSPTWSSGPLAGAAGDTSFFNHGDDPVSAHAPATFGSVLDHFSAHMKELPTPTTPTGLDASQSFSKPGQNMVTVLNRVEVTFKAQFSELGAMRKSLVHEQEAAQKLGTLTIETPDADIKDALADFVASYNAGIERFTPSVAKGGILEGSWEAERARFATERDINYILNGAEVGLKGGLAALGISADPKTKLASVDQARFDTALASNKGNVVAALTSFAGTFIDTIATLNAAGHAQVRQMANLDRAVHWIDANKAAVQKEFGPGAAATPSAAFAKAAALYDDMARLSKKA